MSPYQLIDGFAHDKAQLEQRIAELENEKKTFGRACFFFRPSVPDVDPGFDGSAAGGGRHPSTRRVRIYLPVRRRPSVFAVGMLRGVQKEIRSDCKMGSMMGELEEAKGLVEIEHHNNIRLSDAITI